MASLADIQQTRVAAVMLLIMGTALIAGALSLPSIAVLQFEPGPDASPTLTTSVILSVYFGVILSLTGVISLLLG